MRATGLGLLVSAWMALVVCLSPLAAQPVLYSHGEPTPFEQYMLELVNAARADPGAEAARLGIDLNQGLAPGTIENAPKPPLAFHPLLIAAARGHSDWMLSAGIFSHTGAGNSSPTDRARNEGYTFPVAENIGYRSTAGAPDYFGMTRLIHESLVISPGHRVNLMDATYSVVGLGLRPGSFGGQNTFMAAQNFSSGGATVDSGPFILGVCYDDANGNGVYDPGEGVPSVRVDISPGSHYVITSASGGYALPVVPGSTNTETVNLPFAVQGTPWSAAIPHDASFRASRIAASGLTNVQVVWSGGPLTVPVTNTAAIRRPVRVNYRLLGTDGRFYDRTMVTALSVKADLELGSVPTPAPTPTPTLAPTPTPSPSASPTPIPAGTKEQRITFKLSPKMVYGGEYILRAKFSAKGPVNYAVDPASAAQIDGNKLTILKADAQFKVTASHPGDATWKAAEIEVEGTAAKRPQRIAFTTKGARKVGDDFTLSLTVNSELDVTVTSSNPAIVRINGDGTAIALGKGKVELTAAQPGDDNHLPAKPVKKKVTVK